MVRRPSRRSDFHFAIICALPLEFDAVYDSLDEVWAGQEANLGKAAGDPNRYAIGSVGNIPLVLVLLPGMGVGDAAGAAASLRASYNNLSVALIVGVCGALPTLSNGTEVLLGDIIISKYVVRYDFGRQYLDEFKPKTTIEDTLGRPNKEIRILSAQLETRSSRDDLEENAFKFLQQLQKKVEETKYRGIYHYPGTKYDKLFDPKYRHKHQDANACVVCRTCVSNADPVCENALEIKCADLGCNDAHLVPRDRLAQRQQAEQAGETGPPELTIHTGGVSSADTVMKSGEARDQIAKRDKTIAFEMEGAGVWDELPSCIIIKGVCDYADSHKSEGWQNYAAATAASTAKALLGKYFEDRQLKGETQHRLFYVPFAENHSFIGREGVIKFLSDILFNKRKDRIALFGMGGVGKTQVALRIAHMMKDEDPECSVLWLPAFSMASFEQACMDLIDKLNIPRNKDNKDAKELIQRHFSSECVGRWLLILDNADSEDVLQGSEGARGIYTYLPRSQNGQVLVTTRWRKIAVDFAKQQVIPITEMERKDAKDLLQASLISEHIMWKDSIVNELLHLLTDLPLAVLQAAAYINIFEISLEEYLRLCRHSQQDMMELMGNHYQDDTLYDKSQGAVATTWLVSFSQLQRHNAVAARLLFFIMWIEPQAIPRSILPNVGSEQETVKAIGTLKSYGFLQERPERGIFDMHHLVHMVMQFWANDQSISTKTKADMLHNLDRIFQSDKWEERDTWRAHLPHVLHIFGTYQATNPVAVSGLGYWAGRCLVVDGRIKEAVTIFEQVVQIEKTTLAQDHPNQLASQHALAGAYHANGQIQKAVTLLNHVVKTQETILAHDHPDRLASQHALAQAYKANSQVQEAVALSEYIVKTLAEDHPSHLLSQQALAIAYQANGQIQEAVTLSEHIVKRQETTLAQDHLNRLASQHTLATAYLANGQIQEAVTLLKHVVKIQETTLAQDHPNRLASQHALAQAYCANSQFQEAVTLLEHVVKRQETTLAEDHPSRLASQNTLAGAYMANGQAQEAVALLEHVVKIKEKTPAKDCYLQLVSQHRLALAYYANSQIQEAVTLLEHVVKIQETTLAQNNPDQLASQYALAKAYRANGQIQQAVALLKHICKIKGWTTPASSRPD